MWQSICLVLNLNNRSRTRDKLGCKKMPHRQRRIMRLRILYQYLSRFMIKSHDEHPIYSYSLRQRNISTFQFGQIYFSICSYYPSRRALFFKFFKEIGIILSSNTLTDMPSNGTPAFDKNICWLNSFSFRTRGLPCYSELKHCSSILKL